MAVPKGFRNNINIYSQNLGPEHRRDLTENIAKHSGYLPKGISIEDHDQSFVEFMNSDTGLAIYVDGVKVPVFFLTLQRWTEFSKTWQFTDKEKNVELPFITIVRKPDIQVGTNQNGNWNIPGNQTYPYYRVPTWDGVRQGYDLYKIPQPTCIDLTYEVRLFTNKLRNLNEFNMLIQRFFQSRQCYIFVNEHPIPVKLETIGDESNIDDFENRTFYIQMFEMQMLGYIMDEKDFEVVPTINRTLMSMEVAETRFFKPIITDFQVESNVVTWTFDFKPNSNDEFFFTAQYDVSFTQLIDIIAISRIIISVNDVVKFDGTILTTPLIILANDIVKIKVTKGYYNDGIFKLIGNTII